MKEELIEIENFPIDVKNVFLFVREKVTKILTIYFSKYDYTLKELLHKKN